MTAERVTLTEDEREALTEAIRPPVKWSNFGRTPEAWLMDAEDADFAMETLAPAVERIIAARLAEQTVEHVHQIEALAAIVTDLDAELARVEALVDRWSGEWATPRWIDDLRAALDGGES